MNTAVSAMMELVNELYAYTDKGERTAQAGAVAREAIETLVLMVSPFAPHTAEELWARYGHEGGLALASMARVRSRRSPAPRRSSSRCR